VQFVNWRAVNAFFCGLMWVLVFALALVILVHRLPEAPPPHHVAASALR
jgi:hypothetical protein